MTLQDFLAWLICVVMAAGVALALWLTLPGDRGILPARPRRRLVSWGTAEVGFAILNFLAWQSLPTLYAGWRLGPAVKRSDLEDPSLLWLYVLAAAGQVATLLLVFRLVARVPLYQLGVTAHRLRQNVIAGLIGWLVATPAILFVNFWATRAFLWIHGVEPTDHPLTRMVKNHPFTPTDWVFFVLTAAVAAPVTEELLFRGVLLPWCRSRAWGSDAAIAGALGLAAMFANQDTVYWSVGFVVVMVPGYLAVSRGLGRWLPDAGAARAIYSTALFFAASHSFAWPTPIPLFLLGLALGYLVYRTQSLVGPIVFHGVFNGMAWLVLMLTYLSHGSDLPNGKDLTSAIPVPSDRRTCSFVPGCSEPRFTYPRPIAPNLSDTADDVTRPTSCSSR